MHRITHGYRLRLVMPDLVAPFLVKDAILLESVAFALDLHFARYSGT